MAQPAETFSPEAPSGVSLREQLHLPDATPGCKAMWQTINQLRGAHCLHGVRRGAGGGCVPCRTAKGTP